MQDGAKCVPPGLHGHAGGQRPGREPPPEGEGHLRALRGPRQKPPKGTPVGPRCCAAPSPTASARTLP